MSNCTHQVDDHVAMGINAAISLFKLNQLSDFSLPSSLDDKERAYVHQQAALHGLLSKSTGHGSSRHVVLQKLDDDNILELPLVFKLSTTSEWVMQSLLNRWPSKQRDKSESQTRMDKNLGWHSDITKASGRLPSGIPQTPPPPPSPSLQPPLAIDSRKADIVKGIWSNNVLLVCGKPGCGKSTQIPQFILDECWNRGEVCRIICAVPQRSFAVSLAKRVSSMRGEVVGQTVGYQIRLESRASPRTLLTFCTNEVLLRTLMSSNQLSATHIIMDEIQERDKFGEVVLVQLRRLIVDSREKFRLVLVCSETNKLVVDEFVDPCPSVTINVEQHFVKEYYMEDILERSNYLEKLLPHQGIKSAQPQKCNSHEIQGDNNTQRLKATSQEIIFTEPDDHSDNTGGRNERTCSLCDNGVGGDFPQCTHCTEHLLKLYNDRTSRTDIDHQLILFLLQVLCQNYNGTILVFLPSYDEITKVREMIVSSNTVNAKSNLLIFTMYTSMHALLDQREAHQSCAADTRKIILCTDVAESCISVSDACHVIDAGRTSRGARVSTRTSQLRASAVARNRSGICFHLFPRSEDLPNSPSQLLCSPLYQLALQIKLLGGSESVAEFFHRLPQPPHSSAIQHAVHILKTIDALDESENISELGQHLVDLPIDPRLGKMILYAVVLKCLDPILTITCALAFHGPFVQVADDDLAKLAATRNKFAAGTYSDHMCMLRAFQAWQKARCDGWEKSFCRQHFLSLGFMEDVIGLRSQLLGQLRATGFVRARGGSDIRDLNTNSENWAVVKAAICAGSQPNIARLDRSNEVIRDMDGEVTVHPSSVLSHDLTHKGNSSRISFPSDWIIFHEKSSATDGKFVAECCSHVTSVCVALFSGASALTESELVGGVDEGWSERGDSDSEELDRFATFSATNAVRLNMNPTSAAMMAEVRLRWHSLFARRIRNPSKPWQPADEAALIAVVNILTSEEDTLKLMQPCGIGQRPRPATQDEVDRSSCFVSKLN